MKVQIMPQRDCDAAGGGADRRDGDAARLEEHHQPGAADRGAGRRAERAAPGAR